MSIFYFVYTKHQVLLIYNENKEIYVANLMIIEVDFLLGINIWGLRSEWVTFCKINKQVVNNYSIIFILMYSWY